MTRNETTAFLAEKLNDILTNEGGGDRVLQCEPDNGTFVYYDAASTIYDAGVEPDSEPELWLVSVFPAKVVM